MVGESTVLSPSEGSGTTGYQNRMYPQNDVNIDGDGNSIDGYAAVQILKSFQKCWRIL